MNDKLSLKEAWSGHVNHVNFGEHQPDYRNTAEARVVKYCMHMRYVKSQHKDDTIITFKSGVARVT